MQPNNEILLVEEISTQDEERTVVLREGNTQQQKSVAHYPTKDEKGVSRTGSR